LIVTYLRSSSLNCFYGCETDYFITYVLGHRGKSGLAAAKGNAVHKAMETLAWKSKMTREGVFEYEDETFGPLVVADITPEWAIQAAYDYYVKIEDHLDWNATHFKECREWTYKALNDWGGYFDPMNQIVVEPEVKFDFVIEEDWARYTYETPQGPIEGFLGIKGTTDLVVADKMDTNLLECVDYKTGRQSDFNTGIEKDYWSLWHDKQLLLYYYALRRLFPDKAIMMTILFVKFDGPFRMMFGDEQYAEAEAMLKKAFDEIRANERPGRVPSNMAFKCKYTCAHGQKGPIVDGKTRCEIIRDSIYTIGMDATMAKHGIPGAFGQYGSGGGRQSEVTLGVSD